jgi:nitrate/TMAO reductase-like tetraheme cytochrome c subunit
MEATEFKSPQRKLVRFFRRSRDSWKRKYMESKRLRKKLSSQVRAVEKSRAHWKEIARKEWQRSRELGRELEELKSVAW